MKTVYSTQEGVKMNSALNFGTTKGIRDQFQPLMDLLVTVFKEEFNYFYRVTDDGYIQLAYSYNGSELEIKAQYKLRFQNLKEDIIFIVKNYLEANAPFEGYPLFENSSIFTKQEFDDIIASIENPKKVIIREALKNQTPLIHCLKENKLNPYPSGGSLTNWRAKCPSGRAHTIMVSTKSDEWGCGYCRRKGKQEDLERWLLEIKKTSY